VCHEEQNEKRIYITSFTQGYFLPLGNNVSANACCLYIYDYSGFELAELKSFGLTLAGFYTFALIAYVEIQRIKQRNDKPFSRILILISYVFSGILMFLFGLSFLDCRHGNLALNHVYDPVFQLAFCYFLLST
jgi:hypothetical protein